MGEVTIDSIQIEIESNSTNASKGLDALAGSLEKLKKNGSFKTVSTNLNNLSAALKNLPNVHSASNALRTLANSIEKLKGVGSVSSLTNSLGKLPAALKSVSGINLDKVAPQIQKVADTVAPLSNIKAGGLSTMVNSMKKLGDVTESLDDETIERFAKKVELLNAKLAPLSAKMATIKTGFNAINSGARKAAESVEDFGDGINASALNMTSFIEIAQTVIGAFTTLIQKLSEYIHMAAQWDGVKYQFGNAFGEQADIYYEKITKITEALNINKQAFMENSAMAASMLIGFGVDKKDAREMGLGYTQLAYDIWAAYNNVYETLDGADGAMAAVRSAIAGEVEPIRRAGFTIVEATLEQTAANHGLNISLANATEAQKSYLRYLELVDQAQRKGVVGTYAREMQTAEGMMRTFSQQLKSLAQAFGSLFLPILVKVMPYVQAFVEILQEGVFWLASLFGIEIQDIGDTWTDFSSGVGSGAGALDDVADSAGGATGALNDATKAAKELKNATIGIDELNVISPNTSSGSGGSGGGGAGGSGGGAGGGFSGLDIESLWDDSIFDNIQSKVDDIKSKLKGVFDDWLPSLGIIGAAMGAWTIAGLLEQLGEALKLSDKFEGAVKNIRKIASSAIIMTLQFMFMEDAFSDFLDGEGIMKYIEGIVIGAISSYLLYKQWGPAGLAIGLGITAGVSLKTVLENGGITDAESLTVALTGLATGVGALSLAWKALSGSKFIGELSAFIALAREFGIVETFATTFPKLSAALAGLGPTVTGALSSLVTGLGSLFTTIGTAILAHPWVTLAIALIAALVGAIVLAVVDYDFTEVGYKIGQALGNSIKAVVDFGKMIKDRLEAGIKWLVDTFGGLSWSEFWEKFAEVGWNAVEGLWSGIVDGWNNLKNNIKEFVNGFVKGFKDALGIHSPSTVFAQIGQNIIDGLMSMLGVNAIKDRLLSMWTAAKDWWDKSKSALASYVPSIGDIKTKLSDAWTAAKDWWDKSKATLSTYTPSIGKIWENLKSAWETTKTWWSKNRGSLSTYTPSIGKIWEKLKSAWETTKTWWSKNRGSLSTYTPSIGSISSKLSSAWSSAKTWWSKKSGMSTYTPSIGSIKDKIVSAWNTAKKWWSSNASLSTKLNISVPKLTVNWGEVSALGKTFKYPKSFSVKFAADGGVFDAGSLIWAGERGPEIVANASGGKTGVMNVQQMQDAVYEGVYAAMMSAMRGNGEGSGSQVIRVYLDGKEIAASVEKTQRERGASIMGNEVYSY